MTSFVAKALLPRPSCQLPAKTFPGTETIMTKLRLLLLATSALSAMQFVSSPSHAQTAPLVVAQAKEELGPDGKPKQPPKGAPKEAPPKGAPPPGRPAPPAGAPPHPAPPAAAPPPRPAPPPPAAAPPPRPTPPPPPPAAPAHPAPPAPP